MGKSKKIDEHHGKSSIAMFDYRRAVVVAIKDSSGRAFHSAAGRGRETVHVVDRCGS